MKKNSLLFDQENEARKKIEFSGRKLPETQVGEIWWYYVGVNIGQEISKGLPYERPCILIQEIENSSLVLIAPLSSKMHNAWQKYCEILRSHSKYGLRASRILFHQIQIIDKKRLLNRSSNYKNSLLVIYIRSKIKDLYG